MITTDKKPRKSRTPKVEVIKSRNKFWVYLSNCGNADYGQNPTASLPDTRNQKKGVVDMLEARTAVKEYIRTNKLGGGNWTGGRVVNENGKEIAFISFNGCIWQPAKGTVKKPFNPLVIYNQVRRQLTICYSHIYKQIAVSEVELRNGQWRFADPFDDNKGLEIRIAKKLEDGNLHVQVYATKYDCVKGWLPQSEKPIETASLIIHAA